MAILLFIIVLGVLNFIPLYCSVEKKLKKDWLLLIIITNDKKKIIIIKLIIE